MQRLSQPPPPAAALAHQPSLHPATIPSVPKDRVLSLRGATQFTIHSYNFDLFWERRQARAVGARHPPRAPAQPPPAGPRSTHCARMRPSPSDAPSPCGATTNMFEAHGGRVSCISIAPPLRSARFANSPCRGLCSPAPACTAHTPAARRRKPEDQAPRRGGHSVTASPAPASSSAACAAASAARSARWWMSGCEWLEGAAV